MPVDPQNVGLTPQQIQQGLTAAQTLATILSSVGAFESLKWAVGFVRDRRAARANAIASEQTAKAAAIKAECDAEEADHQRARDARKDALTEAWQVADQRKEQSHDCQERLEKVEKEMQECLDDRAQLRGMLAAHEGRLGKLENGNATRS